MEIGKIILDLPPDMERENPRNSEGAFITLKNGEILFAYSKFKGKSNADHAFSDICLLRSKDGGLSFGGETTIMTCEDENAVNIMSLSFLEMNNGDIGIFYLVRSTYSLLQMFMRRSPDGGMTWSERILCTPVDGFFVVNNDRVIRLSNGRILIPAAMHAVYSAHFTDTEGRYFDERSDVVFFYSDDDGSTWNLSKTKCSMPYMKNCKSGLQEPGLVELSPGYIRAWARTDLGRQYEMFSCDYGDTWTGCEPSYFTSPCSPLSMKKANNGTIYAVWNPIPVYNGKEIDKDIFTGGRTPLVIAKSTDYGASFSRQAVLEDEPDRGYCYCAIHYMKDAVLLAYCAGGPDDKSCLARTRIRYIELAELEKMFEKS